uniref:Uncharacterized protein n=1 Tax=Anopheles darlingi TaxID=43151 RepID=A0A2M4D608_ANODA
MVVEAPDRGVGVAVQPLRVRLFVVVPAVVVVVVAAADVAEDAEVVLPPAVDVEAFQHLAAAAVVVAGAETVVADLTLRSV